jgi:cytochrome c biogenesis protein CcmG, thiol:disulfide interchange protein DsbE
MVPIDELEQYPRRPWWRRLLIPVIVVTTVGVGLAIPATQNDDLPDFELARLGGGGTLSSDDLKGAPVVLNFFAGWCQPCREEAPLLQRTYEEYRADGVRFVGLATNDTAERALDFVKEFGITYDVVMGTNELEEELGINGLPQTLFVNSDWELASVEASDRIGKQGSTTVLGAIEPSELKTQIESLLEAD